MSQHSDTRMLILQAARALFMELGYDAVSTRQIAKKVGLSQPAIYRHFVDKEDLYLAVLLDELNSIHKGLIQSISRVDTVREKLIEIAIYMLHIKTDTNIMLYDMAHNIDKDAQLILKEQFLSHMIAPIADVLREAQQSQMLRSLAAGGQDLTIAAYLFLGMLRTNGTAKHAHMIHQHAELIVGIFMDGLLKR